MIEDNVQLPRLMMVWLSPPAYHPGSAELDLVSSLLTDGKNSRLYKKLVYELQIAQSVDSYQDPKKLASEFAIIATARPGVTLSQLEKVIQEELDKLKLEGPSTRELQRITNQYESNFIRQLESSSNKADLLNRYYYYTGNPDYFNEDFQRYKALDGNDIREAIRQYLKDDARVVLSIVPEGKTELAAKK
jgi:zinc protease